MEASGQSSKRAVQQAMPWSAPGPAKRVAPLQPLRFRTTAERARRAEVGKAYHKNNREERLAYLREWQKRNPQARRKNVEERNRKAAERQREFRKANPELARAKDREHYKKHGERKKANRRAWARRNKERMRELRRKATFGLTPEQFNAMLAAQSGRCAICGYTQEATTAFFPVVDHCHSSGVVRGLLCSACNGGMGLFKDNPENLLKAAEYLRAAAARIACQATSPAV